MKTLFALAVLAASAPALASDVTSFYHSPYATGHGAGRPDASSSPFYRTPFAQPDRAAATPAPAAGREAPRQAAAERLAPPPKA